MASHNLTSVENVGLLSLGTGQSVAAFKVPPPSAHAPHPTTPHQAVLLLSVTSLDMPPFCSILHGLKTFRQAPTRSAAVSRACRTSNPHVMPFGACR